MTDYVEVVSAARETITAILAGRFPCGYILHLGTDGGATAKISARHNPTRTVLDVQLPSLPADTHMTRTEADYIVALVAHECCHALHTDFTAGSNNPALQNMINWLEDARIEALELSLGKLPGLLDLLDHLGTVSYHEAAAARKAGGQPLIGAAKVDFGGVIAHLTRASNGYNQVGAKAVRAAVPAKARALLDKCLVRMGTLTSTQDAHDMAKWVLRALNALDAAPASQPQPQPQPQPDTAEGEEGEGSEGEGSEGEGSEGEEGEGSEGEGSEGEGSEGEGSEGEGSEGEGSEGEGETTGQGDIASQSPTSMQGATADKGKVQDAKADAQADKAWDKKAKAPDAAEALKSLVKKLTAREEVSTSHADQSALITYQPGTAQDWTKHPAMPGSGKYLRSRMTPPGILRDQVSRLIRADERHGTERYRSTGRLDRRALTRMSMDAQNVFTRRTMAEGVDTAIMFLLDGSGSMDTADDGAVTRFTNASLLALHLAEAAEAARGICNVSGFFGIQELVHIATYKPFHGPLDVDLLASGKGCTATPLSPAILVARDALLAEQATRRILIVLTDGECDYGVECTQAAVKMAESKGIEVLGIGLGLDVSKVFTKHVNVTDMGEVATQGLEALVRMLDTGRDEA
jgi:cobalamin biosynthesis protein CobT